VREPSLQSTALRYAANDLPPPEAEAFETRLATDQDAREALAEAVRLSAEAVGQRAPLPDPAVRAASRARLDAAGRRSGAALWAVAGALAAAVLVAVGFGGRAEPPAPPPPGAPAAEPLAQTDPLPHGDDSRTVAELWADMSTPDTLEKSHDDEMRLRQKVRDLANPAHVGAAARACADAP
jgi:hypothetical protein